MGQKCYTSFIAFHVNGDNVTNFDSFGVKVAPRAEKTEVFKKR